MKKTIFYKEYSGVELCDVEEDISNVVIEDYSGKLTDIPSDEHGFHKGKFRVKIVWCSEDDCDCTGFGHASTCHRFNEHGIAF